MSTLILQKAIIDPATLIIYRSLQAKIAWNIHNPNSVQIDKLVPKTPKFSNSDHIIGKYAYLVADNGVELVDAFQRVAQGGYGLSVLHLAERKRSFVS